ncbi:hypothetical protein [Bradyrhizobium sp. 150]|uniref:hypothetical protein n=1 Tax=Bradyrhizobium sp. 150 TaxID=2782625 RepID=UPI001FFB4399|nr:hypothetical protein [Bradyrhizobium sp. 150]MCK1677109.1 hypothetical protein [Bradyrhizobium sp. 150]
MIDDLDDLPPSDLDEEVIEGAAEDSASGEQATASLPRVLRYAVLASRADHSVYQRLAAEIETVCPGIALTETWIDTPDAASGCALAVELDHRAVREDKPECRSLADGVRLISLALPRDRGLDEEHRRVASALVAAFHKLPPSIPLELAAEIEALVYGWAALPVCAHEVIGAFQTPAIRAAAMLGATAWRGAGSRKPRRQHSPARGSVCVKPTSGRPCAATPVVRGRCWTFPRGMSSWCERIRSP